MVIASKGLVLGMYECLWKRMGVLILRNILVNGSVYLPVHNVWQMLRH